jgi:hypothetical protein
LALNFESFDFIYLFQINEFNEKLNEVQDELDKKIIENELMQNELNQMKEFRKKKIQMQRELEEVKF